MNPRLDELLHQRQLMVDHLAWLDEEIAKVSWPTQQSVQRPVQAPAKPAAPVAPKPEPLPPLVASAASVKGDAIAQEILEKYRDEKRTTVNSARRGVYVVFAAAMGLLAACVVAFYLYEKMRLGR